MAVAVVRPAGAPAAPAVSFGFQVGETIFTFPGNIKQMKYGKISIYIAINSHISHEIAGTPEFGHTFFEYLNDSRLEIKKEKGVTCLKVPDTNPRVYGIEVERCHGFPKELAGVLYYLACFHTHPHVHDGRIGSPILDAARQAGERALTTLTFFSSYENALVMQAFIQLTKGNVDGARSAAGRAAKAASNVHKGVAAALAGRGAGAGEHERKKEDVLSWLRVRVGTVRGEESAYAKSGDVGGTAGPSR